VLAARAGEQRVVRIAVSLAKPGFQDRPRLSAQWGNPFLAPLAGAPYVCSWAEMDVPAIQAGEFADPKARLERYEQQSVISPSDPGRAVRRV
jgi:hypothetical protein